MNVDVEELQMFDGIASCANHIVNFRIGKYEFILINPENKDNLNRNF